MVQKTASASQEEPEQRRFEMPSVGEHLFQVVDVYDMDNNEYNLDLGPDDTSVKCEVVGGEEEGRSMLMRISLDDAWKGFFNTRLFLKAINEEYKGDNFPIDSDNWIGRQFHATVVHNLAKNGKTYANIDEYLFDKQIEQAQPIAQTVDKDNKNEEEKAWDEGEPQPGNLPPQP